MQSLPLEAVMQIEALLTRLEREGQWDYTHTPKALTENGWKVLGHGVSRAGVEVGDWVVKVPLEAEGETCTLREKAFYTLLEEREPKLLRYFARSFFEGKCVIQERVTVNIERNREALRFAFALGNAFSLADLHEHNFGLNADGEIKIFDFGDGSSYETPSEDLVRRIYREKQEDIDQFTWESIYNDDFIARAWGDTLVQEISDNEVKGFDDWAWRDTNHCPETERVWTIDYYGRGNPARIRNARLFTFSGR